MSPKSIKSRFCFGKFTLRGMRLPLAIAVLLSGVPATALHASVHSVNTVPSETGTDNQRQPIQLISQTGSTPPDVVIDTNPQNSRSTPSTSTNADPRFSCQLVYGEYTVMYYPKSQPGQSYPWAVPSQMGGGWTPQQRCYEISRRLESYRADGLEELKTSVENNYETICATTQRDPSCRIVLTVPPGQDVQTTLDRVFDNLIVADGGQQTQGINTFAGTQDNQLVDQIGQFLNLDISGSEQRSTSSRSSSKGINLRPFLDRADGGTGTQLRDSNSVPPTQQMPPTQQRLNPDNFR